MGLFTLNSKFEPVATPKSTKGVFDRSSDAVRTLREYQKKGSGSNLVVAKAVRRHKGIEQHLGYRIVDRTEVNRFGEVSI